MDGRAVQGTRTLLLAALAIGSGSCGGAADPEAGPVPARSMPLADLRPAAPSFFSAAGGGIRVSVTVRNRGRARAPASIAAVFLTRRRARGVRDKPVARIAVGALVPRAISRLGRTLRQPRSLRPGNYWVIACADVGHRVREMAERNNCSRSLRRVRVRARSGDRTAPQFGGIGSVTTCIPGPRGGPATSSRSRVEWEAATDAITAPAKIVYDIYQGKGSAPSFDRPAYSTRPGATSFTTPELSSAIPWYFGVRARDEAGNRDGNRTARQSMNICR